MELSDDMATLVDSIVPDNIFTQKVERAMRLVDRGLFVLPRKNHAAYDRSPFRTEGLQPGQIHLSASPIYCSVLEVLDLHKGQSFLNLGSGSGYLSTLVGFLIGENGHNHGVELHSNVVEHARESVRLFSQHKYTAGYSWARPEFVHGSVFALEGIARRYDRIYVGAQLNLAAVPRFSELLKEGGIMVVPVISGFSTFFQRVKRTADGFEADNFMNVSFTEMVEPSEEEEETTEGGEILAKRRRSQPVNLTNPNANVSAELLALFNPRSLECLATLALRRSIAHTLRASFPLAIEQKLPEDWTYEAMFAKFQRRHRALHGEQQGAVLRGEDPAPGGEFRLLQLLEDAMAAARRRMMPHGDIDNEHARRHFRPPEAPEVGVRQRLLNEPDEVARRELTDDEERAAEARLRVLRAMPREDVEGERLRIWEITTLMRQIEETRLAQLHRHNRTRQQLFGETRARALVAREGREMEWDSDEEGEPDIPYLQERRRQRLLASVRRLPRVEMMPLTKLAHIKLASCGFYPDVLALSSERGDASKLWSLRMKPVVGLRDKIPQSFNDRLCLYDLIERRGLPNGRLYIEDWFQQTTKAKFDEKVAAMKEAVRVVGGVQYAQEQSDYDPSIQLPAGTAEALSHQCQKDSIKRFEQNLEKLLTGLPLSAHVLRALRWNLFRE